MKQILAESYIDVEIEIKKIKSMQSQINPNETFGGPYGFLDQATDLIERLESDLAFYLVAFTKLRARMKSRIQEYKEDGSIT